MAKTNTDQTASSNVQSVPPTTNSQLILGAIEADAIAKRSKAVANFNIYLQNAAGIGEHPDIVEECSKLIQDIGEADSTIETLRRIVS